MEGFIERVGQSYLERKAFAAPQQLENFAKKQLTGGGEQEAEAKKSTAKTASEQKDKGDEEGERTTKKKGSRKTAGQTSSDSSEKDKEIARLKKQLAQLKLENTKAPSAKSAFGLSKSGVSRASNGQKVLTKKAAKGDKETKELAALETVGAVGRKHDERKSKRGKKEASGSKSAKAANIVEISPTNRRTSTSQHNEHDGGVTSKHGGGSKSEDSGHAGSNKPHPAAASEGTRRLSMASSSVHGSTAKSMAPPPMHEHLPVHAERFGEERVIAEWGRQYEQERGVYAIEVEEEVSRSGKDDSGGVVEVESSEGRMLYRVE